MRHSRLLRLALLAWLAADLGRSLHARSAFQTVAEPFPRSSVVAWPPGSGVSPDAPLGERSYAAHCAVCHGDAGDGRGPAAPMLHPKPRDLTSGVLKFRSTRERAPRRSDVLRTLRYGLAGTSMPGWADILPAEEIDALAEVVRAMGKHEAWAPEDPPAIPAGVFDAADVEVGKVQYVEQGCPACHGPEGRGDGAAANDLRDVWNQPAPPRDLTAPWTFRGGEDPTAVYLRIAHGMGGTPMPAYLDVATPEQIASIVFYLGSLARTPPWREQEARLMADLPAEPVARGAYLVRSGMCHLCHTPVDSAGIYQTETHHLAGGMRVAAGAHGVFFAANLTSDETTGLGKRSPEEIVAALRSGHGRERRLNYWAMPWMAFGSYEDEDANAIAAYLRTVAPVQNAVPGPLYFGTIETVVRKSTYSWPILPPAALSYGSGNFGTKQPQDDWVQWSLIWAQRALFGMIALAWLLRRRPGSRGGVGIVLAVLALIVAAVVLFIERYPALTPVPAGVVISGFAGAIPSTGEDALVRRGRYLFAVSSCAFCHQADGGGGNRLSWQGFGTTWSRNLTPHPTGLGEWSDAEILRALTSGVARDGRAQHWQAMPWDHFSNLSLADQRALLAFVRSLPPIERALLPPAPPGASDCGRYTFFVDRNDHISGCE